MARQFISFNLRGKHSRTNKQVELNKFNLLEDITYLSLTNPETLQRVSYNHLVVFDKYKMDSYSTTFAQFDIEQMFLYELKECNIPDLMLYTLEEYDIKNNAITKFRAIFENKEYFVTPSMKKLTYVERLNSRIFRCYFSENLNLLLFMICVKLDDSTFKGSDNNLFTIDIKFIRFPSNEFSINEIIEDEDVRFLYTNMKFFKKYSLDADILNLIGKRVIKLSSYCDGIYERPTSQYELSSKHLMIDNFPKQRTQNSNYFNGVDKFGTNKRKRKHK